MEQILPEIFPQDVDDKTQEVIEQITSESNKQFESLIQQIMDQSRPCQPIKDKRVNAIVRTVFALLLKITDTIPDFLQLALSPGASVKGMEKLVSLYTTANRMRVWYIDKKKEIANDFVNEEYEKHCQAIMQKVKDKAKLIMNFKPAQQDSGMTKKAVKLVRRVGEAEAGELTETDIVKTRLSKWKKVQMSVKRVDSLEISLTAAAMELLQNDISSEQVISELELYYLRGMTLFGMMEIINSTFSSIPSRTIRMDVLSWLPAILRSSVSTTWGYSQVSSACGIPYQILLRKQFFNLIKQILQCAIIATNSQELTCLMENLKWNYTISDHSLLKESELLNKLTACERPTSLSKLWGLPLESEDGLPEVLLNSFEYIVVQIAFSGVSIIHDTSKPEESSPSSGKSPSQPDSQATSKLLQNIQEIIIKELTKAAESYKSCSGMDSIVANKYSDISREDINQESKTTDKKKLKNMFIEESKKTYSPDFCTRLLRLSYHLYVAAEEESKGKGILKDVFKQCDWTVFLKLLEFGSSHQQFLILQMIPYIVKLSYKNVDQAAAQYLGPSFKHFSKSNILDLLFAFALERREGVWVKENKASSLGYALSKCTIRLLQRSLNTPNELTDALIPIIKTILFGKNEDVKALPEACHDNRFVELILSISGGEFEGIHKGAIGCAKDKKEITIVAFASSRIDPAKASVCEWEFCPKIHDQVIAHLVNEEGGELTLDQMPVQEFVLADMAPNYDEIINSVGPQDVKLMIKQLQTPSTVFKKDTLVETLKVKLLKVLMLLLKSQKALCCEIFSEELITLLLESSLKYPKTDTSKTLLNVELTAEAMRKIASQSDYKALMQAENSGHTIQLKGSKLILSSQGAKMAIRINAHLNLEKLQHNVPYEYVIFNPDIPKEAMANKIVFVEKHDKLNMESLSNIVLALCIAAPIAPLLNDIKNMTESVVLEISEKDMTNLGKVINDLDVTAKEMSTSRVDNMIAEYLNMKLHKETKANNVKDIIQDIINSSDSTKEIKTIRTKKEIFEILFSPSDKREVIFKEGQDHNITEERASCGREYAMLFKQNYEKGEEAKPETYSNLLHDLHIFYTRHLLLNILLQNTKALPSLSVDVYKKVLAFLLVYAAEADLMKYGVGYKKLSKRLNAVLKATLSRPDSIDIFFGWIHQKVADIIYKGRIISYSIYSSPQSKLEEAIYLPFICRHFKAIIKFNRGAIIKNKGIDVLMDDMLTIAIAAEKVAEKYHAMDILRQIISSAAIMIAELPRASLEKILGSDSIKALARYFNQTERKNSYIWKIANEILMKANTLYRTAARLYSEEVQTYYTKNAFSLFIATEIMKEFPDFTLISTYLWGKQAKKDLKGIDPLKINTPIPFYDTQYCIQISDIQAEALQISAKKQSHSNFLT